MSSTLNDPQRFKKTFGAYRNKSTDQQASHKLIQEKLPDVLKQAWRSSAVPNTFNIFNVGCADGAGGDFLILEIVKKFLLASTRKPSILHQAVEPHAEALAVFQASAESWAAENKDMEWCFQWYPGSWEEYQTETKHEPKKFHLINFIHSIYLMEVDDVLCDCIENRLADNGLIFCLLSDSDSPTDRFFKAFGMSFPSSETLVSLANKNGWKYESFTFPYNLDVTEMFDETSVEGNLLLDFVTVTFNFREVTDPSEVEQKLQHWWNDSAIGSDGKRRSLGKVNAFVIYKAESADQPTKLGPSSQ